VHFVRETPALPLAQAMVLARQARLAAKRVSVATFLRGDMDLGDWGVGESGHFAPTFTHPIHSPGLCHFDAARAAGEIFSTYHW